MAQSVNYPDIITSVLREQAGIQPSLQPITIAAVCDPESGHFLLTATGWENKRRVEAIIFHARLADGLVVIEDDNTEEGLSAALIEAGIPAENIMTALAFARRQQRDPVAA
jgi:hypothetical protein